MFNHMDQVAYNEQRRRDMLHGPHREPSRLGYAWSLFIARSAVRRAARWVRQAFERQGELCLKLAPACEMPFS